MEQPRSRNAERLGRVTPQGDKSPPLAQGIGGGLEGGGLGDKIDGHVHPDAPRQFPKRLDDVLLRSIHDGIRPHLAACLELLRRDIDGDHAGVRPSRHHHHVDSYPAARSEDGDVLHRGDTGPADHLVRGHYRVADDGNLGRVAFVVEPLGNMDPVSGGQFNVLRIPPVHLASDEACQVVAQSLPIDPTPTAVAATQVCMGSDDIPRFQAVDAMTGFDDLPQDFVPDDDRVIGCRAARPGVVDSESGTACDHPRHRLAGSGFGVRPLFQNERFVLPLKHHRFHRHLPGCEMIDVGI